MIDVIMRVPNSFYRADFGVFLHFVACDVSGGFVLQSRAEVACVQIHGFMKNRPSLEDAEAALARKPPPIAVSGLARFTEGVRLASSWVARASTVGPERAPADLRALEALVTEGQRLPVILPELKAHFRSHTRFQAL